MRATCTGLARRAGAPGFALQRRGFTRGSEAILELPGRGLLEAPGAAPEGLLRPAPGQEARQELAALRWQPDRQGRIQLEAKADLSSRLGRCPDRADAVAMAFYPEDGPDAEEEIRPPEGEGLAGCFGGIPAGEVAGTWA